MWLTINDYMDYIYYKIKSKPEIKSLTKMAISIVFQQH